GRGRSAPDYADRIVAGGDAEAVGGAAGAGGERDARRSAAGRDDSRADDGARRWSLSRGRRSAVRSGALDDLCGRGVVALEDDGRVQRPRVRILLASGGALA